MAEASATCTGDIMYRSVLLCEGRLKVFEEKSQVIREFLFSIFFARLLSREFINLVVMYECVNCKETSEKGKCMTITRRNKKTTS